MKNKLTQAGNMRLPRQPPSPIHPPPVTNQKVPRAFSDKMELRLPKTLRMKFGVIVFPGSNCDHDAFYAVTANLGQKAEFIWHDSDDLRGADAVILPGGFA